MARVLITGSADGLGLLAARHLIGEGHEVTLHARSEERAREAAAAAPGAADSLAGDLSSLAGVRALAAQADATGRFDAVIHNAAIGDREPRRAVTEDGLPAVLAVNVLAPYLLTVSLTRPGRLVFLSSGMHHGGDPGLADPQWTDRPWNGSRAYADSKLYDTALAFAFARRWPDVPSNAVDPGWVPTRMGGPGAPDDLEEGYRTQTWLAVSDDPAATASGRYLHHRAERAPLPAVRDPAFQDRLLELCARLTGVRPPA
ncbi:SDR family NAD(P)-dependent oxidoreductase [Streptomyces avicenniae]|uniref:SDR family NAD(P)-dependent oxidoreductase n=1 Tax=Streptomyces avicenniae TaxID=500153 RepID=UPI00069C69BB|nr:SDR family NAD(P)-dependent oxidoreductase [Streptomyces avicenniae]